MNGCSVISELESAHSASRRLVRDRRLEDGRWSLPPGNPPKKSDCTCETWNRPGISAGSAGALAQRYCTQRTFSVVVGSVAAFALIAGLEKAKNGTKTAPLHRA